MKLLHLAIASGVIALVCLGAVDASADADKDAKIGFQEGVALFKEGQFEAAAEKFEKAYELKPTYRLLFNIGQAWAAARRYDVALRAFERYLVQGGDEIHVERRDEVIREIERLRPLVGFFEIKAGPGLTVRVDGQDRGTTPFTKQMLTAGETHRIEALRGGAVVYQGALEVSGGMVETIVVEEAAAAPSTAPLQPTAPPPRTESSAGSAPAETEVKKAGGLRIGGWVTAAVGAAALVAGGALGVAALVQDESLSGMCPNGTCSPARQDEIDSVAGKALAADILIGVGAAAAATGVVLLIISYHGDEAEVTATPTAGGAVLEVLF